VKDFAPITMVVTSPHVLVVHPSVPARNVKDLVALIKANSGQYSYASPGRGQSGQLAAELFKLTTGLPDLVHVPFRMGSCGRLR
jgi:tripartite-type tricarboxylate transporter receptor subunit TctC